MGIHEIEAEIDCRIAAVVRCQRHRRRAAVAVHGHIAALQARRDGVTVRGRHGHGVGAGAQVAELIEAVAVGHGGGDDRAALQQVHRHGGNPRLADILDAVAVQVVPDKITDAAGAGDIKAEVDGRIGAVVGGQGHVGGAAVTVVSRIAALHIRRRDITHGQRGFIHVDHVIARAQAGELIKTKGIGRCGAQRLTTHQQAHRHAGNPRLALILDTVAVQVVPDKVADAAGAEARHASRVGIAQIELLI